jgi:hypothetical protein
VNEGQAPDRCGLVQGIMCRCLDQEGVSVVEKTSSKTKARRPRAIPPPAMSMSDLAQLGGGKIAYIKVLTTDEAKEMFPAIEGIPAGINLYALHAADGTPLALTDSRQAAVGHAMGDELEIASLH